MQLFFTLVARAERRIFFYTNAFGLPAIVAGWTSSAPSTASAAAANTATTTMHSLYQSFPSVGAFGAFLALKLSRSQRLWQGAPVKDFCWWDLGGVCRCRWCLVCSGRWLVGPFRTRKKLFYLTRPQLALLNDLPYNDR